LSKIQEKEMTEMAKPPRFFFGFLLIALISIPFHLYCREIDGIIDKDEYPFKRVLDRGRYILFWHFGDKTVSFGISARTRGWVAVGFDPIFAMEDADMVFGWIDESGTAKVIDAHSVGRLGPHPPDEEQNGTFDVLEFAGSEKGGVTVIEFSRPLTAEDKNDKAIQPEGGNTIIWAYGKNDDFTNIHKKRGTATLQARPSGALRKGLSTLLAAHLTTMSLSFVLMAFGILIPRYMKKNRWWLKAHKAIGLVGACIGVAGVGTAIYMVSAGSGEHFRVLHSYFGLVTIIAIVVSPSVGYAFLKLKKKEYKLFFKKVHPWIGRASLLLMLGTVVLGLFTAGIM
jgi:hypothetical protein